MQDHAFKLNVGIGFRSVNPEIRIIKGQIIEVLLYYLHEKSTHIISVVHVTNNCYKDLNIYIEYKALHKFVDINSIYTFCPQVKMFMIFSNSKIKH